MSGYIRCSSCQKVCEEWAGPRYVCPHCGARFMRDMFTPNEPVTAAKSQVQERT
jgi:DNA-directed RNA polymerase subunit RPC12/RpoP